MICWIAGWPHNGSTLMRQILKESFGISTVSKYLEPELDTLFPGGEMFRNKMGHNPESATEYVRRRNATTFIKTHELPEDDSPAIFVVRDGRDAVCSLSNFYWIPVASAITGQGCIFGSWSAYWYGWDPEQRPDTLIVRFRDMVERPNEVVLPQLEQFLGRKPVKEYVDDFEEKRKQYPYLFKDRIGVWKQTMSESDISLFNKCHGDVNRRLGYE